MSDYVKILKLVKVMFLRQSPEGESPEWVMVDRDEKRDGLLLTINGVEYFVKNEVIESLYDFHQDIPR